MEKADKTKALQPSHRAIEFKTVPEAWKELGGLFANNPEIAKYVDENNILIDPDYKWPVHKCIKDTCEGHRYLVGRCLFANRIAASGLVVCNSCGDYSTERIF
jgi:hypothetical protein